MPAASVYLMAYQLQHSQLLQFHCLSATSQSFTRWHFCHWPLSSGLFCQAKCHASCCICVFLDHRWQNHATVRVTWVSCSQHYVPNHIFPMALWLFIQFCGMVSWGACTLHYCIPKFAPHGHSEGSMCCCNLGFLMEWWGGWTLHTWDVHSSSLLPFLTLDLVWDYIAFPPNLVLCITKSYKLCLSLCFWGTLGWESEST